MMLQIKGGTMSGINLRGGAVFNYLAIEFLTQLGNRFPSQGEIDEIERELVRVFSRSQARKQKLASMSRVQYQ